MSSQHTKYRENKQDKAIEENIKSKINWGIIEDQLVNCDLSTGKQYAYVTPITFRKEQLLLEC